MIASRLDLPVVPVRLDGLDACSPQTPGLRAGPGRSGWRSARRCVLRGDDYAALARQVEEKVRSLYAPINVFRSKLRLVAQCGTLIAKLRERMSY